MKNINHYLGELNKSRFIADLQFQVEQANKIYKKKPDIVICEYCKKELPKKEAGSKFDFITRDLTFHHKECFDREELKK